MNNKRVYRQGSDFYVREILLQTTYPSVDDIKDALARAESMYDVSVDTYVDYGDVAGLEISACRNASDAEIKEFIALEEQRRGEERDRELALFKKLKAQYEGDYNEKK